MGDGRVGEEAQQRAVVGGLDRRVVADAQLLDHRRQHPPHQRQRDDRHRRDPPARGVAAPEHRGGQHGPGEQRAQARDVAADRRVEHEGRRGQEPVEHRADPQRRLLARQRDDEQQRDPEAGQVRGQVERHRAALGKQRRQHARRHDRAQQHEHRQAGAARGLLPRDRRAALARLLAALAPQAHARQRLGQRAQAEEQPRHRRGQAGQ